MKYCLALRVKSYFVFFYNFTCHPKWNFGCDHDLMCDRKCTGTSFQTKKQSWGPLKIALLCVHLCTHRNKKKKVGFFFWLDVNRENPDKEFFLKRSTI